MEYQVSQELREQRERSERYRAERRERQLNDRDLQELLEATNARRRARGEAERTREDAQSEFGKRPASPDPGPGPDSHPTG
jgi:hypothetical protein